MACVAELTEPYRLVEPLAIFAAYHAISLSVAKQTFGKALMGLRVWRVKREPRFFWSLSRCSVGYFGADLLGVGLLLALFDNRHRTFHDHLWRSEVVAVDGGRLDLRCLSQRMADFVERLVEALRRRKGVAVPLTVFLAWLLGLSRAVQKGLDVLWRVGGGRPAPAGESLLAHLSGTAQGVVAAAATATSVAVVATVPPVGNAVKWVMEPRYYFGAPSAPEAAVSPPPPRAAEGVWRLGPLRQVKNVNVIDTTPLPAQTWKLKIVGRGYALTTSTERIRLTRSAPWQYEGVGRDSTEDCASPDTLKVVLNRGYNQTNIYRVIVARGRLTAEVEQRAVASGAAIARNCASISRAVYVALAERRRQP